MMIKHIHTAAKAKRRNDKVCSRCGKTFSLGYNGIGDDDGKDTCDNCAGVRRDQRGHIVAIGKPKREG